MSSTDSKHPMSARAAAVHEPETVSFGPFSIRTRLLEKNGVPVKLGGRATDILRLLLSRAGEVIPKEEILAYAWSGLVVEEISLRVHVAELRKALARAHNNEMQLTGRVVGRACAFAHAGVIVSRPAADLGVMRTQ